MNTIKFNDNNNTFEVLSYNKNTYFSDGVITSSGTCNLKVTNADVLNALYDITINDIEILHNNVSIYHLENISCRVVSISEFLNDDHMDINVSLVFDNE